MQVSQGIRLRGFFASVAIILFATTIALHVGGIFRNTAGCDFRSIAAGEYTAYCENERFADYEHGSFWYDLEPGVVQAMKEADVLFLGNSRLQLGFDAHLLASAMSEVGLKHYMLGFGYKEHYLFASALMERYGLRPRALVVNADPFFVDALSAASRPLLEAGPGEPMLGYLYRRLVQRVKTRLCSLGAAVETSRACQGTRLTIYRSRQSGSWRFAAPTDDGVPIVPVDRSEDQTTVVASEARHANFLRARAGLPVDCMLILGIPSPSVPENLARRIADEARMPFIGTDARGLKSFDGSHLTSQSATEWTRRISPQLKAALSSCRQAH